MSLVQVEISTDDFDLVYNHLVHHMPAHRNMHMRQMRSKNKKRVIRYLHAMRAQKGSSGVIDGMISGPEVFWRYQINRGLRRPQITVFDEDAPPKERDRILRQFLKEILHRVYDEQSGPPVRTTRLAGQYYLRRKNPGMDSSHRNCISAVNAGVLSQTFVSQLESWNFELLHPRTDRRS
jgi:hypothetical protein